MADTKSPGYMLDTNICIYAMQGRISVLGKFREHGKDAIGISSLVLGEMAYGVAKSHRIEVNTAALKRFQASMNVVPWDASPMWMYGENYHRLKSAGRKIGELGLLIGCQALAMGAVLVTNNTREFERIEGLKLENWV